MKELVLPPALSQEIEEIYDAIVEEYDKVAHEITLTCEGCPDNCCDSYFLHYTYSEWAYLWEGLRLLEESKLNEIIERARQYVTQSQMLLEQGERPQLKCPLLEGSLCGAYKHRLMICRTHGVPASLTRPDGQSIRFPGCFRCQDIVAEKYDNEDEAPVMDRTILYRRMAQVEAKFLGNKRHLYPKRKQTIAEMIVNGPPENINSCLI